VQSGVPGGAHQVAVTADLQHELVDVAVEVELLGKQQRRQQGAQLRARDAQSKSKREHGASGSTGGGAVPVAHELTG
jgi:hypothetical protein